MFNIIAQGHVNKVRAEMKYLQYNLEVTEVVFYILGSCVYLVKFFFHFTQSKVYQICINPLSAFLKYGLVISITHSLALIGS